MNHEGTTAACLNHGFKKLMVDDCQHIVSCKISISSTNRPFTLHSDMLACFLTSYILSLYGKDLLIRQKNLQLDYNKSIHYKLIVTYMCFFFCRQSCTLSFLANKEPSVFPCIPQNLRSPKQSSMVQLYSQVPQNGSDYLNPENSGVACQHVENFPVAI